MKNLFILTFSLWCLAAAAQIKPAAFQTQVRGWGDEPAVLNEIPYLTDLTNAVQISAGLGHAAALLWDGRVKNWGHWASQADHHGLSNIVSIASGELASLAINSDGLLKPWGAYLNFLNAPANLASLVEVSVDHSTAFNGPGHHIVLKADGTVAAWGKGNNFDMYNPPPDLTNAVAVAAGFYDNLALRSDGSVALFGEKTITVFPVSNLVPLPENLRDVIAICTSGSHSLALLENGQVIAWGYNRHGQCDVPADLKNTVAVSAGIYFSMALQADGQVIVWGITPDTFNSGVKNIPSDLRDVIAISAGNGYCLALTSHELAASPPVIYAQPRSKKTDLHEPAYLAAYATGFPPIRYQWFKDGREIPGARQKFLYFGNVSTADYGDYTVKASNQFGETVSETAALNPASIALGFALVPSVQVFGDVGARYLIQYSDSVAQINSWQTLATVALTNSPQWYFDLSGLVEPRRFYRSQRVP